MPAATAAGMTVARMVSGRHNPAVHVEADEHRFGDTPLGAPTPRSFWLRKITR
jgi:hypothetical protein